MLIALDTETGGLSPLRNPLLAFTLWAPGGVEFSARVRGDHAACQPKALEINGLDPSEGESPLEVDRQLFDWWEKQSRPKLQLVGHNIGPFDVPFMSQLPSFAQMIDYHYRDTCCLALAFSDVGLLSTKKVNLKAVATELLITYGAHDSKQDAMAAWHCWHRMMDILNGVKFDPIDLRASNG